jgi:hypothetical protein
MPRVAERIPAKSICSQMEERSDVTFVQALENVRH